jgi:5-methyltetrahydrofolate--homocysteine methyltransferase
MNRKYTNRKYLDALEKKVLVFDGAMGTSLQVQNLTAEHFGGEQYNGCNDYLVISYPEAVEKVHRSFLEVGVDVLETDTFRSNRITMKEYGLQDRVLEINETAARLARRLADEYSILDTIVSPLRRWLHWSLGQTPLHQRPRTVQRQLR